MERETRYCTTQDGVRIGYCIEGEGPALIIVPFFIQSFFFDSSEEILASLAVRELCAGKGFLFADRGEHVLRGFEDPARIFDVHWRE